MRLLNEVFHNNAVNVHGRTILREAARGIIIDQRKLLMVYSEINGDYKFPGGGIKRGESHNEALMREIREETGVQTMEIIGPFGEMIEYDLPLEKTYDVFKKISYYYWCKVGGLTGEQSLDQYEKDLQLIPLWVDIDEAIRKNISLTQDPVRQPPRWIRRDLEVLKQVRVEITPDEQLLA